VRISGGRREAVDQLRPLWALSGCTNRDVGAVEALTDELHASPGQVLVNEGDDPSGFFLVVAGHAVATIGDVEFGLLGPGAFYGETALLDNGREPVTVTASTAMLVRGAAPAEFEELLRIRPLAQRLLQTLASRQRLAPSSAWPAFRSDAGLPPATVEASRGM
jgi:CRP-like cAMP-binding protein